MRTDILFALGVFFYLGGAAMIANAIRGSMAETNDHLLYVRRGIHDVSGLLRDLCNDIHRMRNQPTTRDTADPRAPDAAH